MLREGPVQRRGAQALSQAAPGLDHGSATSWLADVVSSLISQASHSLQL